jgi:hypothetical protein
LTGKNECIIIIIQIQDALAWQKQIQKVLYRYNNASSVEPKDSPEVGTVGYAQQNLKVYYLATIPRLGHAWNGGQVRAMGDDGQLRRCRTVV